MHGQCIFALFVRRGLRRDRLVGAEQALQLFDGF
jgi:hypothetical protein